MVKQEYFEVVCYFYEESVIHALEENEFEVKKLLKIETPKE